MGVARGLRWAIRLRVAEKLSKRTDIGKIAKIMDSKRKIQTHEEFVRLSRLVGVRQAELFRSGKTRSEARRIAVEEIAKSEGFNSGSHLESELGKCRSNIQAESRNGEPLEGSAIERFVQWVRENDFVPNSKALAHFYRDKSGDTVTYGAFNNARGFLESKGWRFEKVKNGWVVNLRPIEEPPAQQQKTEPTTTIATHTPTNRAEEKLFEEFLQFKKWRESNGQ